MSDENVSTMVEKFLSLSKEKQKNAVMYALARAFKSFRNNLDNEDVDMLFSSFEDLVQVYTSMVMAYHNGEIESKKEVLELVMDTLICAVDQEYIPDWMTDGGTDEQS